MGVELSLCPTTFPFLCFLPTIGIHGREDVDAGVLEQLHKGTSHDNTGKLGTESILGSINIIGLKFEQMF